MAPKSRHKDCANASRKIKPFLKDFGFHLKRQRENGVAR
jgi:hypothetical protein